MNEKAQRRMTGTRTLLLEGKVTHDFRVANPNHILAITRDGVVAKMPEGDDKKEARKELIRRMDAEDYDRREYTLVSTGDPKKLEAQFASCELSK